MVLAIRYAKTGPSFHQLSAHATTRRKSTGFPRRSSQRKPGAYARRPEGSRSKGIERINLMLHYALIFLVVALVAGVLGFGVVAGTAAYIAKILFIVFLVLFLISFISGRRGPIV